MNNSHYPNLELCKKLTSLGFPNTEKVMIVDNKFPNPTIVDDTEDTLIGKGFGISGYVCHSVMEMVDVVPKHFHDTTGEREDLTILYHKNGIDVGYAWFDVPVEERMIKGDTFPNTLADLIIWLVENSHITFDKR